MTTLSPPTPIVPHDLPFPGRPPSSGRPSRLRRSLSALGSAAFVGLVIALSAMLHLHTQIGLAAARDMAEAAMTSRIRGTAHIGSITHLGLDGIEMHDFTVTAPDGAQVISADRLSAQVALGASLRRGQVIVTPCEMEGGTMLVSRGPDDQIDLVYAMEVPDDRWMIPILIRDIRLLHQRMVFELPPIPFSIEMDAVYGLVDMQLGHEFVARMDQVHGYVNIPIVHIGFSELNGRIASDDPRPLIVRMRVDLDVADPSIRIDYHAPGAVGRPGGAGMGIELGPDMPDPMHIGRHRSE
jgi:hypothetical protein